MVAAGCGFQAASDDGGVQFWKKRHHGDASVVGRVGLGAFLVERSDGQLVPGRGGSGGGDCGEEKGQGSVQATMFVVLQELRKQPMVSQGFVVA